MKNLIIGALALALAIALIGVLGAQSQRTANVEVRVWEDVNDPERNYVSARPEGGSWRTLGTVPVNMNSVSASGRYRYGDLTLAVPLPDAPAATATPTATATATPAETRHGHPRSTTSCRCARIRVNGGCDQRFRPARICTTRTTTTYHSHAVDDANHSRTPWH